MEVKINYDECLSNFACSIRRYFNLEYRHNTLDIVDRILEKKKPKNVVTILCDGMGDNILNRVLSKDSFLLSHRLKGISSVFPPTTVAATTSAMTGLNPVETGMLGWDMYYKELDKTITVFLNCEKSDLEQKFLQQAQNYNNTHMLRRSIMDELNDTKDTEGVTLFPFGEDPYEDRDDLYRRIEEKCAQEGMKYIYGYDTQPDTIMHLQGCDSEEAKTQIEDINEHVRKLCERVKDTVVFVIADHGHKNVQNIFLEDYPQLTDCFERNTSIESRAVNFFIRPDKKETFVSLFNHYFSEDFDLYEKQEVIASKLFGPGEENPVFRDALGDYLAIAKGNKALLYEGNSVLKSMHAGNTEDERIVPLIVAECE